MAIRPRPQIELEEYLVKLDNRDQTSDGREIPDPVPVEPPLGYIKQPSMIEQVRNMVRSEALRQAAIDSGAETFEEADDFDVADDPPDPTTPYEAVFDPPVPQEPAPVAPQAPATPAPATPAPQAQPPSSPAPAAPTPPSAST